MYSDAGSHRPWPLGSSRWQLASHKPRLGLSFLGSLRGHKPVSPTGKAGPAHAAPRPRADTACAQTRKLRPPEEKRLAEHHHVGETRSSWPGQADRPSSPTQPPTQAPPRPQKRVRSGSARRQDGRMRRGPSARRRARALTCGKRCRGCASRACPVCSSRRRSSDAASGEEAGARSRAAVGARRGFAPQAATPLQAAPEWRVFPGSISPEPRPSLFSRLPLAALTVLPLLRRRSIARFGSRRKSIP